MPKITSNNKDLDAWVEDLSKDKINRVLAYLTLKETEQLKKEMKDNEGKVVTPIELEENSIVPVLPYLSQDKDGKNIGKKIDPEMYREVPQMDKDMDRWTRTFNVTTDISKMKRVIELNTKRDDEKQYELDIRSKPMPGPRKGLYDDRPKEDEWNKWTTKLIELTKKLKETPINQLFDYRPIKAILDKLEVLEAKEHKVTSHVIDLKEEQVYNPHGEYSGMDVAKEKDTTVYRYSYGGRVETFDIKDMSTRDIDYWLMRFRKSRVELEGKDIPWFIHPKVRQAEIDAMKSIEKELMKKIWDKSVVKIEIKDKDRNKAQTRFGRVYASTGTKPLGMSDKDWKQLTNEIKDAHADDPTPRPNNGETDDDLYQEVLTEEALKKELADAKQATSEQDWYEKAGEDPQLTNGEPGYYRKALSADPHEWPGTLPCGATKEEIEAYEKDLKKRTADEFGVGIQPPEPWPEPEAILPNGEIQPSEPWPHSEAVGETVDAHQAIPPHYNVARYQANQAKIKAEQKNIRCYKVLNFFCKAIIGSLIIYSGLIIMERLLVGQPIATFLHKVLIGE